MGEYFFAKKTNINGFCDKMAIYGLFAGLPLTESLCLSIRGRSSYWEAGSVTGSLALYQVGWASQREGRVLAGRQGSYTEVGPLNGGQGLSLGGRASHWEAGPLTGSLAL